MITGGEEFVWASYALAMAGLAGLVVVVIARAVYWARRAKASDQTK
jgi:hypothetical protein